MPGASSARELVGFIRKGDQLGRYAEPDVCENRIQASEPPQAPVTYSWQRLCLHDLGL